MTLPGLSGLAEPEVLQRRGDTLVLRARAGDGTPVLVKTHASDLPTDASRQRLRREHATTATVAHPHLVRARELVDGPTRCALVLHDPGGAGLDAALARGLVGDAAALVARAVEVGTALSALHARGLVHRSVDADHVEVTGRGAVLVDLYDAAPAGSRPRRPSQGQHPAPEQVTAAVRPVDAASDQYGLAATVRAGLGRLGAAPPPPLAAVLERAGSADPRRRYRSMAGLVADLRRALAALEDGDDEPFPLAEHDPFLVWQDPSEVVGRDGVLGELVDVVDAAAEDGTGRVAVVRGPNGSGRSAVARALVDRLADRGVVCGLSGVEAGAAEVAFRAGVEVMDQVVDQVLAAPDRALHAVRAELRSRLGVDLALAVRLIPPLAHLVGPQEDPGVLAPGDIVSRSETASRGALGAVAAALGPLVAVFDDAPLLDPASLSALAGTAGRPEVGPMVVVLVAGTEPSGLDLALARLRERGVAVHEVELAPLSDDAVATLVAAGTGTAPEEIAPLAAAVAARAAGSPGLALADVWGLLATGDLAVDPDAGRWRWTPAAVRREARPTVEDVALDRVGRLDPALRELLAAVAVSGRAATVEVLASWAAVGPEEVEALVDRGIADHVLVRREGSTDAVACLDEGVRRAALAHLDADRLDALGREVARAALATVERADDGRPQVPDEVRFELVRMLGGQGLVPDGPERDIYVSLCEDAARAAHRAAAFRQALGFHRSAIAALGERGWDEQPSRAFDLHLRAAENALVLDEPELVDELLDTAWAHDPPAEVRVRALRVVGFRAWTRQEHGGALEQIRAALEQLGEPIPARPNAADVARELAATRRALGTTAPEDFLDAPRITDTRVAAALDAMVAGVHLAYVGQPLTHVVLVLRGTRLTARYGVGDASAYFLAGYGMLSIATPGGVPRGLRFGRVGMELAERVGGSMATMVGFAHNGFIRHWGEPLAATVEPLSQACTRSLERRTRDYGLTCGTFAVLHALLSGAPLAGLADDAASLSGEMARLDERAFEQRVDIVRQAVEELRGHPGDRVLDGPTFSAPRWLDERPRRGELALIVHTLSGLVALCHGRSDDLAASVDAGAPLLRSAPGQAVVARHRFHAALRDAEACLAPVGRADRARRRARAERSRRRLARVAAHAPENAAHQLALVEAVLAEGVTGRAGATRALAAYDEAVHRATESGALGDLGVIAERAARFHLDRRRATMARHLASVARDAWEAWGAEGLAASVEDRLTGLVALDRPAAPPAAATTVPGRGDGGVDTFAEAGRLLGQELEVREFLERIVAVLMRHAHANRGFLVLGSARGPVVEVAARTVDDAVQVTPLPSPDPTDHDDLCLPALQYVLRTRQVLVLPDPARDRRLRTDAALRRRQPQALLGLPVGRPTGTQGAFVFEADGPLVSFEPDRVEALRLLAAQAITAIDHSRLSSDVTSLARDVARLRSTAETLTARAEADPLTGVANRLGLEARLQAALSARGPAGGAAPGTPVGVLFCDLDDFKAINDTWGHAVGDAALVEVARRLGAVVREGDVVARLGGDEFLVVAVDVADADLEVLAGRALRSLARPLELAGIGSVEVGVSIGVGRARLGPLPTPEELDALVSSADVAMYRAKRSGKNQVDLG